ncbi:MAG: insulinase family protein [Acidobacteriota bacterium]
MIRRDLAATALLALLTLFAGACTTIDTADLVDQPPPVPPSTEATAAAPEAPAASPPSAEATPTPVDLSAAAVPLDAKLPVDPAVRVGELPNGLKYYLKANQKPEQRAELRLVVDAGSILEDDDQLGLAHFVEHMAFNGSENFKKAELVDYLQSVGMRFGADINAGTGFDQTSYRLTIPTDDSEVLDRAFLVLADWAGRVVLDPDEVEKERGVIVEEWRRSQGAGMRLFDRQLPVIFGGSRYTDRLPIGTKESIETSPIEALERFYKDWYRTDLQAVIAVGDFDVDAIEDLVKKHLGPLPAATDPRERPSFDVPGHKEARFSIETDPELTNTSVAVLFKHEPGGEGTAGDYRRSIVENLGNQMLNARLGELAQQAEPPFVFAFAGGGAMVRDSYIYRLDAVVQEGEVTSGLGAVLREVERVDRHGFTQGELDRAKREVLRGYEQLGKEQDKQPSAGFASEYQRAFLTGESIPGIEYEVQLANRFVPGITLEEVNALTAQYITDENRVFIVSGPEKENAELPSETQLAGVFEDVAAEDIAPWVDQTREEPLLATRPTPGTVEAEKYHGALDVTEWHLSNGVRVVLKPTDFQNDQIAFTGWSFGGSSLVPDEDSTSADFATFLLGQSGLGSFSAIELQKALAGKVASAAPSLSELTEGIDGGASPEDLETALQLVYLWFTEPRLDLDAYENLIGRMGAMVENRLKNPGTAFGDKLGEVLSSDHPRRRPLNAERLGEIDPQRALEIYRERFADASDFTFVMVGNFELDGVRPLIETYLGGLPSTGREETWRDVGVVRPEGVVRFQVEKGLEPKSSVNLIFHGEADWVREERFAMRALSRVMEIRLTDLVREELGATYTIGVSGSIGRWPQELFTLSVNFGCDPSQVDGLVDTLFADFAALRENGPQADRVEKVRENFRREREVQLQRNGFWLGALETYYRNDLDLDKLLAFDELLDMLTPELVHEAAKRYLDESQYVLGVLKPEAEPQAPPAQSGR